MTSRRRSRTALDVNQTLIAVIELSQKIWLVAGIIPGVERQPQKKLEPSEDALLRLLERWRKEAEKVDHKINRIAVAFEAAGTAFGWRGG
jgi:transposase